MHSTGWRDRSPGYYMARMHITRGSSQAGLTSHRFPVRNEMLGLPSQPACSWKTGASRQAFSASMPYCALAQAVGSETLQ